MKNNLTKLAKRSNSLDRFMRTKGFCKTPFSRLIGQLARLFEFLHPFQGVTIYFPHCDSSSRIYMAAASLFQFINRLQVAVSN